MDIDWGFENLSPRWIFEGISPKWEWGFEGPQPQDFFWG
jgi:hypothetical protein